MLIGPVPSGCTTIESGDARCDGRMNICPLTHRLDESTGLIIYKSRQLQRICRSHENWSFVQPSQLRLTWVYRCYQYRILVLYSCDAGATNQQLMGTCQTRCIFCQVFVCTVSYSEVRNDSNSGLFPISSTRSIYVYDSLCFNLA